MVSVLDDGCKVAIDPQTREWLDYETSQFIENELSDAADSQCEWLTDICGLDDLFDVRAETRAWWDEQVRSFQSELLRRHRHAEKMASSDGWPEDFELESRCHLAFFSRTIEPLL